MPQPWQAIAQRFCSLTDCVGLTNVNVNGATSIVKLDVSGNRALTGIDISTNKFLSKLDISDCSITSFKNIITSSNNRVETLSIGSSSFDSVQIDYTETGIDLSWFSYIKSFDASYGQISDADWAVIKAALPYNLQELHLVGNGASENDTGLAGEYLTNLDVSKFTGLSVLNIADNESLESLDISNTTSLNFHVNSAHMSGLTALKTITAVNTYMSFMYFDGLTSLTTINCTGAQVESISIMGCRNIKSIDLTNVSYSATSPTSIMMNIGYTGYTESTFESNVTVTKSANLSIQYLEG